MPPPFSGVQTHWLPPDLCGPQFSPDLSLPVCGLRGVPQDWILWEADRGGGMVPTVQMSQALDPRPTSSLGSGGQTPECTPGSHHQDGQECSEGTLKK